MRRRPALESTLPPLWLAASAIAAAITVVFGVQRRIAHFAADPNGWVQGLIGIKPMMCLCFSFDHRVLDGLQPARFLTSCHKWLEAVTVESPVY